MDVARSSQWRTLVPARAVLLATLTLAGACTEAIEDDAPRDRAERDVEPVATSTAPADAPAEVTVCAGGTYPTIARGLAAVADGGTVHVCAGTYAERLLLGRAVTLRGAGRDATIIDGGAGGTTVVVDGVGGTGGGIGGGGDGAGWAVIEGVTIRNGAAYAGGGVRCRASRLRLAASALTGNRATDDGGGLEAQRCRLVFTDVRFSDNHAGHTTGAGGAAFLVESEGSIRGVEITGNTAEMGGGVAIQNGAVAVTDASFRGNRAYGAGGGMFLRGSHTVERSVFADNIADGGGGLWAYGGAPSFRHNQFTGNRASISGGGMGITTGTPHLFDNTFTGNTAEALGGALMLGSTQPVVDLLRVEGNNAGNKGGGLYITSTRGTFTRLAVRDNTAGFQGGGLYVAHDASTFDTADVAANHARAGADIHQHPPAPTVAAVP